MKMKSEGVAIIADALNGIDLEYGLDDSHLCANYENPVRMLVIYIVSLRYLGLNNRHSRE